jgi:hypothetical protein
MAKTLTREQIIATRRPVITDQNKRLLLSVLMHNEVVYQAAAELVTRDSFGEYDAHFAVLWDCLKSLHDELGALPGREMLLARIEETIQRGGVLTVQELENLYAFIDEACNTEQVNAAKDRSLGASMYVEWGMRQLKHLLEEAAARQVRVLLDTESNEITVGMPECITMAQETMDRINGLAASGITLMYPPGWETTVSLVTESTKLPFFDMFLGGGMARAEVYGLLGPYGSCKTTLAYMLAVEAAQRYHCAYTVGSKPRVAFVISYEAGMDEMRSRMSSYAAGIPRKFLEPARDLVRDLSHEGHLRDYEKARWRASLASHQSVKGEYERLMSVKDVLQLHLCCVDFSGGKDSVGGTGFIDEIASRIRAECRAREAECGLIIIDYARACVDRYMSSHNMPMNDLRHYVGRFPTRCKHKLAGPFDCPVWALQQLSGAANERASGVIQHHTNASEAKDFAENVDFNFQIGTTEKINNVRVANMACTKHRRRPEEGHVILEIHGEDNTVLEASAKYSIEGGGKIISRDYATTVVASPEVSAAAAQSAAAINLEDGGPV